MLLVSFPGNAKEAISMMQRALALTAQRYGQNDARVAAVLADLGTFHAFDQDLSAYFLRRKLFFPYLQAHVA